MSQVQVYLWQQQERALKWRQPGAFMLGHWKREDRKRPGRGAEIQQISAPLSTGCLIRGHPSASLSLCCFICKIRLVILSSVIDVWIKSVVHWEVLWDCGSPVS